MKASISKKLIISAGIILFVCNAFAQDKLKSVQERYSISILGVYDYGTTYSHQGGIDLAGHMSYNPYVETDVGFEFLGPKILAGTVVARPKIPFKVGELFLDAALNLRAFNQSGIGTFALAASLGYRMDYVSVQLGVQRTVIHSFQKVSGSSGSDIVEPLNPIYRLAVNIRPATSSWNLSFGAGNFTLYQYERLYYPIFFLGGHFDFNNHLTLQAEVDLKPSGMFHMTTYFNELTSRAGLTYNF